MPRHIFSLTDETRKTFSGNITEIAEEADVTEKYIYAILAGTEKDPFAPFEFYYKATARAGVSRCHWRLKLDAIDARYDKAQPKTTPIDCLTQKIKTDAATTEKMVEALKDGEINEVEARAILEAVERERKVLDRIELTMQFRVGLREVKAA